MRVRFGLAVLVAGLATSCGGPIAGHTSDCVAASCAVRSSPTPSATATGPSATAHGWTTDVALAPGAVSIRVNVSGPLSVEGGCVPTLTAWLVGSDGRRLPDPSPPAARCGAISVIDIPDGQSRDYSQQLPAPAAGTYTVHGLVRAHLPIGAGARVAENIPVVTLTVP